MKKYLFLFPTLLFLITSCLNDLTVTEFGDVEVPVLDNPENKPEWLSTKTPYFLKYGDVLEIDAHISYSDLDALTYRWVIDGKDIPEDKDGGTYRNHLKWTCDLNNGSVGALYVMAPSKKAGHPIATIFRFSIDIDHPFERGVMVATEQNGKVVYSFLQERLGKPFTEHKNAYDAGTPVDSWLGFFEFWSNESSSVLGNRFHLDRNPKNCKTIEPGLVMESKVSLEQEFVKVPDNMELSGAFFGGYVGYLMDSEHHLYARKSQSGYYTGRYSDQPLEYDGEVLEISTFAEHPYRLGIMLAYDRKNERFLTINNGYNDYTNRNAGLIYEIPEGVELNQFIGEDVVYMEIIPPMYGGDSNLLILSRNKENGAYTFSEYLINVSDGKIIKADRLYYKQSVDGFGPDSEFIVMDNPFYGEGLIYFTDNSDARILRYITRQDSGMGNPGVYHEFPSEIVSLSHSKIGRRYKIFTAGFKDHSLKIFDLVVSMTEYIAPAEGEANSLMHDWKDVGGEILEIHYCYGNCANY